MEELKGGRILYDVLEPKAWRRKLFLFTFAPWTRDVVDLRMGKNTEREGRLGGVIRDSKQKFVTIFHAVIFEKVKIISDMIV